MSTKPLTIAARVRAAWSNDERRNMADKLADVVTIFDELPALVMRGLSMVIITVLVVTFSAILLAPLLAYPGGIETAIAEYLARSFPGQPFGVAYASLYLGLVVIFSLLVLFVALFLPHLDTPPANRYEIAEAVADELARRFDILSAKPVITQDPAENDKWKNIHDELPPENMTVLGIVQDNETTRYLDIVTYDPRDGEWCDESFTVVPVIYWRVLPSYPEACNG